MITKPANFVHDFDEQLLASSKTQDDIDSNPQKKKKKKKKKNRDGGVNYTVHNSSLKSDDKLQIQFALPNQFGFTMIKTHNRYNVLLP